MKVLFRSLEDCSLVSLDHVERLMVRSGKYEVHYGESFSFRVELYHFRFYSLLGVKS